MKVKKICNTWALWLISLIGIISCVEEDWVGSYSANIVQVVGKVTEYSNRQVSSRGLKSNQESKISNMSFFIFDKNNKCIDFQHVNGSNPVFVVNRGALKESYGEDRISSCKLYIVANVFGNLDEDAITKKTNEWIGLKSLSHLEAESCTVSGIAIPNDGFPMFGFLPESVNLKPLGDLPSNVLEIPLKCLYAKVVFNIQVHTDQELSEYIPLFQLDRWEVHNVPERVSLNAKTIDGKQTPFYNTFIDETFYSSTVTGYNPVSGSNKLSFSFYMPEHLVQPHTLAEDYSYPFVDNLDPDDSENYRPELDSLKQNYKPMLVEGNNTYEGKPTYVILKGIFMNHQGHRKSVEYKVYLGSDNDSNFEIERNCQYNNSITIRGISNHDKMGEDFISFDHRVNITDVSAFTIEMERETQLDSHFEVRPIRVKLDNTFPDEGKVVVKVLTPNEKPWIRLEENKTLSDNHCDNGKRLYFTTDLVSGTLASSSTCDITKADGNSIVWVYVDEYTDTIPIRTLNAAEIDAAIVEKKKDLRKATIQVAYYPDGNTNKEPESVLNYIFSQRGLYPVKSAAGRTHSSADANLNGKPFIYYIEYYEEYLHNYDSEDNYGNTDNEGMAWGLNGEWLSHSHKAAYVVDNNSGGVWNQILGWLGWNANTFINGIDTQDASLYYDFYLTRDNPAAGSTTRNYSGYAYTNEIAGETGIAQNVKSLDDDPESAIEYSYNKNKRSSFTKMVEETKWYLPSIDEIEDITMSAYIEFDVFQDKYYWSSQPAYNNYDLQITGEGPYWSSPNCSGGYSCDDISRARATKVVYAGGNNYSNVSSGTQGALGKNVGTMSSNWTGSNATVTYSFTEYTNPTITRGLGNLPRTTKCRIRTVYKPQ